MFSVYNLFFGVAENRSVRDCQTIITYVIKEVIKDTMVVDVRTCLVKYSKERKLFLMGNFIDFSSFLTNQLNSNLFATICYRNIAKKRIKGVSMYFYEEFQP